MINYNNSNSNWKTLLGFGNMQEKLEDEIFVIFSTSFNKTFITNVSFMYKNFGFFLLT